MLPIIVAAVIALVAGFAISHFAVNGQNSAKVQEANRQVSEAQQRAEQICADAERQAETTKKEAVLAAKEDILKQRQAAEAEEKQRKGELQSLESRIMQREESLDRRNDALDRQGAPALQPSGGPAGPSPVRPRRASWPEADVRARAHRRPSLKDEAHEELISTASASRERCGRRPRSCASASRTCACPGRQDGSRDRVDRHPALRRRPGRRGHRHLRPHPLRRPQGPHHRPRGPQHPHVRAGVRRLPRDR